MATKTENDKLADLENQEKALKNKIAKQRDKIRKQREEAVAKNLKVIRKLLEDRDIDLAADDAAEEVENLLNSIPRNDQPVQTTEENAEDFQHQSAANEMS
jgi:hypothetical protein